MQYRQHRYPTQYPTHMRTPTGRQQGFFRNVNNDGAQIVGTTELRRGDKLQLDVLSHTVEAIVVRVRVDQIGIVFRPKLTDHLVDTIRQRQDGRHNGGRCSVGFTYVEMR
jgi:hypothetical protein